MISTMEDIGKLFLKLDDVIEFKIEFDRLYSLVDYNNKFYYNFFHLSLNDRNQFESFIFALKLFKEFPENAMPLFNIVINYCIPLALKINFILWVLNNYKVNGEILKLVDLPYNDIFEKFNHKCHLNDNELKKVFEKFFSKNDELFNLILKLRDDFQNSKKYNKYVELLKWDDESEYYKKAIKSYFYIIKEIIFEVILFDNLSTFDENNILKFSGSDSLAWGDCFDIKMIHASIKGRHIFKIDYDDCKKYAWISSSIINRYQNKGTIIRIKGEFINDGFAKYSKNMEFCSEKIDILNQFSFGIDSNLF